MNTDSSNDFDPFSVKIEDCDKDKTNPSKFEERLISFAFNDEFHMLKSMILEN
jgi:hypothetical protein